MNIILFRPPEVQLPLPRHDARAQHILRVLRRAPGETFDAGVVNGPRGKGTLLSAGKDSLQLAFSWHETPAEPAHPLTLVVGLPRPQTARDLLRDVTSLGVAAMHFVRTEKGEASYAHSNLWRSSEWEECVITGAAQAFSTTLPRVTHGSTLAETLNGLPPDHARFALDNYEATTALSQVSLPPRTPAILAIGSERGWSARERDLLRGQNFVFAHLGARVLRTETACITALALIKGKGGWI